jgi:hypothetical protein
LNEDWLAQQNAKVEDAKVEDAKVEEAPVQKIEQNKGKWQGSDRHDGGRELSGLYGALVNAWNAESGKEKFVKDDRSPNVASSNDSTTAESLPAESLPSPDHKEDESDNATSTRDDFGDLAYQRVRALVACGAPSAPPPPPPCENPEDKHEQEFQVPKSSQGSRKSGRTKETVATSDESNATTLQAAEVRSAPTSEPPLAAPVAHKAAASDVSAAPPSYRPPQTPKNDKSEKNGRNTLSRRTPASACREDQRRPAPEPSTKRHQSSSSHAKQPSFVKKAKRATNAWLSRQRRRVSEFLSTVNAKVSKVRRGMAIHGKTLILAASVVFLIITTILCFLGDTDAARSRQPRSTGTRYSSESYHDSAIANRRASAMQKQYDVEAAHSLAATRYQSSGRLDSRRVSTRQQAKQRSKQVYDYSTEARAAWRDAYLSREQEFFKGLKENDPELASLLEMAGSAGKYDNEDWTRMAAAYDKVMTERYGDKDGINTEDALMADRIGLLMQQQLLNDE